MIEQNDREPGTDLSGVAPTGRGEVTVEVSGGERVQARQRLLAHRLSIALQVGDRRFESRYLLQGIPNPTLGGIGRHTKFLMPAPFKPRLRLAADFPDDSGFFTRGGPQGPANGIAFPRGLLGEIGIRESVERSLDK